MNYKDLDIILNILNHPDPVLEDARAIAHRLRSSGIPHEKYLITEDDGTGNAKPLYLLLNKLERDDYIDISDKLTDIGHAQYIINYNGIEFLEQGGYSEKVKIDRLLGEKLNKQKAVLNLASVATVLVGAYYAIQLLKELFPFLHNLFYH